MKLISMTDFVLQFDKPAGYYEDQSDFLHCQVEYMERVMEYAKFLKQPLILGMFIPCDEAGNVMEEPNEYSKWIKAVVIDELNYFSDGWDGCRQYHEAKERVLFECVQYHDIQPSSNSNYFSLNGVKFSIQNNNGSYSLLYGFDTVEKLLKKVGEINLTESATKKIRL